MTDAAKSHRIVIGATCYGDASSVIEIGCYLAESTKGELQAILIEEDAVYNLSALPSAQVTPVGGVSRPVTPEAMLEAFRRDAAAYEKAIRARVAKRAIRWSFAKRRGEFPVVLNHDLSRGDVLVFGYQAMRRGVGELLVVDYANDMDVSLVELASNVAQEMRRDLHVVLLRKSPEAAIRVSEHSRSRMERLATNLTIMDKQDSVETLLDTIRRGRVGTVMISAALSRDIGLGRLLDTARCPVSVYTS